MTKWLMIGGAVALAYLIFTTQAHAATPAPGQAARPLPAAPPVQNPLPPAQPQTTVVPGAAVDILQYAQQAAGVAGSLADAARKFGLFGGDESPPIQRNVDLSGAAF